MEGWTDFFVAEVGASAALAGLLVVAVSINITRIMSYPLLPGRAAETLIIIASALTISSLALFPGQPSAWFGGEAIAIGLVVAVSGAMQFRAAWPLRQTGDPLAWTAIPPTMVALAAVPELVGGGLLVAGNGSGLYWIATGVILSFIATLQNGWVLLIEILR